MHYFYFLFILSFLIGAGFGYAFRAMVKAPSALFES